VTARARRSPDAARERGAEPGGHDRVQPCSAMNAVTAAGRSVTT
jgi:hypothetical protein